jgi:hypothetical protein
VLFYFVSSQWATVVRDCVVALTADPRYDDIAWVVVPSTSQQDYATSLFTAGGADMNKVRFIISPGNALWIRDYGPHFIWQGGALALTDSHYYPSRPLDNFQPTVLGDDYFIVPTYDQGLYFSGGNFQPGPNRMAVMSSLVNLDNPASEGFNSALIAEIFNRYQGIDTLHIFPQLPTSVDATGHIDMWMYLVDDHTVIISEFKPGSNQTAIDITNNAVPYMQNLGFNVFRTPAWNAVQSGYITNYTYTNAFRVTNRVLVPTYGQGNPDYLDEDAQAIAAWEAAVGPAVELIQINCYPIIYAAGAIHCIVMQVPRYTEPVPAAHVIWPDGGELLISGTSQTISWVASDTDNVAIPRVDLYYTLDGGSTYQSIGTTTNTGSYPWTVPQATTSQAKIKVVVTAADNDQAEAVSDDFFEISPGRQTVYDFKTGGGVDKFGYGYQTFSWSDVDRVRKPVTSELPTLVTDAYAKLAYSDATGDKFDPNRYICPTITTNYESTHVFEFTIGEDRDLIADIGLLWEGFADQCTQAELYVWDYMEGQWGDAAGLLGQNRYLDNWAGNRDGLLRGNIRSDFSRYVDASGQMTLLVYAERRNDETFHDYLSVAVSTTVVPGDMNCDGQVSFADINPFVLALTDPVAWQAMYPCSILNGDINEDGLVNFRDINPFVALLVGL